MKETHRAVILYKRWRLRKEVPLDRVVALVTQGVAPHYGALDTRVVLGLEAQGDDAILAIQRWPSRDVLAQTTASPRYEDWWQAYQPVLAAWDALVEFDSEWETEDLLD